MARDDGRSRGRSEGAPSDADELERFRREWKNEVLHRQTRPTTHEDHSLSPPSLDKLSLNAVSSSPETSPTRPLHDPTRQLPPLPPPHLRTEASAIAVYREAVEHEQTGKLDGALKLYRRAFQLDDQVDRLYDRSERHRVHSPETTTTLLPSSPPKPSLTPHFPFQVNRHLGPSFDHRTPPSESVTANLRTELQSTEERLRFEPEGEGKEVILERLPFEVSVLVLRALGQKGEISSICRFSQVCRKAFLLASEVAIWRYVLSSSSSFLRSRHFGDGRSRLRCLACVGSLPS
jgi:F-box protein 9